jgi:AcrR family transcriptional regulator
VRNLGRRTSNPAKTPGDEDRLASSQLRLRHQRVPRRHAHNGQSGRLPRNGEAVHRRLQQAALELFSECGYDQTTAAQIAARAGVTERTFFRHFAVKREVLFDWSDRLRAMLIEKILQTPDVVAPLQVVTGVLAEFNWESMGPRDFHRQRHAVVTGNPELLERELAKHRSLAVGSPTLSGNAESTRIARNSLPALVFKRSLYHMNVGLRRVPI